MPGLTADGLQVAPGHDHQVVLAWGDPVLRGAPAFDPHHLRATDQAMQFGYNCDFVGFLPLPRRARSSERGLLVVNHEYTNPELMFAGYDITRLTRAQADIQLAAHGMSVVEVRAEGNQWRVVADSPYARRITGTTPMRLTGPAAGNRFLVTATDPTGSHVTGTLGNCSGWITPWGTVLSAEENFHLYFGNRDGITEEEVLVAHGRYGVPRRVSNFGWESIHARFDLGIAPKEPFKFGWVVELDPYDPTWTPKKRTALGRFRHEGAAGVQAPDGRLVLYSGDDITFEYIYKFVSRDPVDPHRREANRDLLDHGTLYVARFDADGTGMWLPLIWGETGLTRREGFHSQGDVLAKTVMAADRLGATRMDRPEDIKVHPGTGGVYIALTNNRLRGTDGYLGPDASNPRGENRFGHVIEMHEGGGDHAGTRFRWDIFLLCGDPRDPSTYFAGFPPSSVSAIACPDNLTFDLGGNLWIATDGQGPTLGINDSLYAVPVEGAERGRVRRFLNGPSGAELCSPAFARDGRTLFLSVQHPGEGSDLLSPSSLFPDDGPLPRPAVVAVRADADDLVGLTRSEGPPTTL